MLLSTSYILFSGIILGLILMTVFYNFFIFIYIKERSFLYYSIMQIFMLPIILFHSKIIAWNLYYYAVFSILSSVFAILFARSFLNTSQHLPKIDLILKFYLLLLLLDSFLLLLTHQSYALKYNFYSSCGLLYLIMSYLRIRQGFVPAWFFLIGWSIFIGTLLYVDIFKISPHTDKFSLFLLGPPIEALLLSMALSYRWKLMQEEKLQQQNLLVHQSRLASMGEMIGNIAHQWKQPLTYLSYNFMNLRETSKRGLMTDNYLNKKLDKANAQLEFMTQTIDNFKDFYLPKKEKRVFSVKKATYETLEILNHQFEQLQIKVELKVDKEVNITSYKNEFQQVLLNLLGNAKDAFVQRAIKNPKITITITSDFISILDNAGGISEEYLKRIYEPYFTTKKGNSGVGLYMSKMIIEKDMQGQLEVENILDGALFKIYF